MGGLCNRMRAIDSAMQLLADGPEHRLVVHWERRWSILNARFDALFEPIPGVVVHEVERVPLRYRISLAARAFRAINRVHLVLPEEVQELVLRKGDARPYLAHAHLAWMSYHRFHGVPGRYAQFVPRADIRAAIAESTAGFDAHTIGVHIRRTDHAKAIESSPLELFEAAMDQALAVQPGTTFYLATDCEDTKARLTARYGERLRTNRQPASRSSLEGVKDAVVELYALSRTAQLLGSYWSSFSQTAGHIGNIPHTVIKR